MLEEIAFPGSFHQVGPQVMNPLELFHPDGTARRTLVLGNDCPAALLRQVEPPAIENADLIVLAPSVAECQKIGWLEESVERATRGLAGDGVTVVLAPPEFRSKVSGLLIQHGLEIKDAILHFPDWASSSLLIPLDPGPVEYAFSELVPAPPLKRILARTGLRLPVGKRLLSGFAPYISLIARRLEARPQFEWLSHLGEQEQRPGSVIISTSWRGKEGATIVYLFSGRQAFPSTVAKLVPSAAKDGLEQEANCLAQLGGDARNSGARVPAVLNVGQVGARQVLLQTALRGKSLAAVLPARPDRLIPVIEEITRWLVRWNRSTRSMRPLDQEQLDREIFNPAAILSPLLEQGEATLAWLQQTCAAALGIDMPWVAVHHDLTMWNILVDKKGRLGIIDWENGRALGLPLVDFYYAVTDAVLAVQGTPGRLEAFRACFETQGAFAPVVARLQQKICQALEISPEVERLCFHACWLHHAMNEVQAADRFETRPFLEIVQWITAHRIRFDEREEA